MQMNAQKEINKLTTPSDYCYVNKVQRGLYMSSVIAPMPNTQCRECGEGVFVSKMYDSKFKLSVHVCAKCGGYPKQIKLRKSLPVGVKGTSARIDILRNRLGERLDSIEEAMHMARVIEYDLRDNRFDPNDYRTKSMSEAFFFENIIRSEYIPRYEEKYGIGGFETKMVMINHLINYFGMMPISKIKTVHVEDFQFLYKCGDRSKDLAIEELGVILKYFKKKRVIKELIELPETKRSKERSVKDFLTKEEQQIVISKIDDVYYRNMIEILAEYALRPGDIRALKWEDINFHNQTFTIKEHFAKARLKSGRKSTEDALTLPMTPKFLEIIKSLPHSIDGSEFVFKSKNSNGTFDQGAVGEARLRIHWNKANEKAFKKNKIKKVSLYVGTKSTSLTAMINDGNSAEDLILLTGHASVKTLKRYAKITEENKLNKVKNIMNKVGAKSAG